MAAVAKNSTKGADASGIHAASYMNLWLKTQLS